MNKAREWLDRFRLTHFNDEAFARIPQMTDDERREYMLTKLDQMVCVDYEAPSLEETLYAFMRMKEVAGEHLEGLSDLPFEAVPDDVKAILGREAQMSPTMLWSLIWEDPGCETEREGCPFFYPSLLGQLTEGERRQVAFITDLTLCLGSMEIGDFVPLKMMIGGWSSHADDDRPWNVTDEYNFRADNPLEQFITTTPHQRTAAALSHVVLLLTAGEVRQVGRKVEGEKKEWCEECRRFIEEADASAWLNFSASFMPARQYIARAHTLMHAAELDYHLTEILEHVNRI